MSGATKRIAKELVHIGLNVFGFTARHTGFGWLATRARSRMGKILGFLGLEAVATAASGLTNQAWAETAPIIEEFAAPIADKILEKPLEYLQQRGFITLNEVVPQATTSWWNLSDAFTGVAGWAAQQPQFISNYWSSWWNPPAVPGVMQTIQTGLQSAREFAPKAGEMVANGMQTVWDYGSYPANLLGSLSEFTGISLPWLLIGGSAISILGIYMLTRPSATATATAAATAHAAANGNQLILNFGPGAIQGVPALAPPPPQAPPGAVPLAALPPVPQPPVVAPAAPAPARARWCTIL